MDTTGIEVDQVFQAVRDISWNEAFSAAAVLLAGLLVIRLIMGAARRASGRIQQENRALGDFLLACLRIGLLAVLLTTVMAKLGIPVTSLVAVLSLAALAVSLSVQNLLGNVVSGVMVLVSKPFKAGDWIETADAAGTVETITLLYTRLITADNRLMLVPNSDLSVKRITNYSARPTRRIDVKVRVGYEYEPGTVIQALLRAAARAGEGHDGGQPPFAAVNSYMDNGVEYVARLYVPTKDYWAVYHPFLLAIREELLASGIPMTYGSTRVRVEEQERQNG